MKLGIKIVLISVSLLILSGCVSQKLPAEFRYSDLMIQNQQMRDIVFTAKEYYDLMEQRRKAYAEFHTDGETPLDAFRFRKGTRMTIEVLGFPELEKTVQINPDGRFDYYGEIINVPAVEKTVDELRAYLTEKLKQYVRNPRVIINLTETTEGSQSGSSFIGSIAVIGEVVKPGVIPYDGEDTVFDALHKAGGLGEDGEWGDVAVIRRDSVFGRAIVIICDASAFYKIKSADFYKEDVQLKPRDIIFVPTNLTPFEHFERDLTTLTDILDDLTSLNEFDQLIEDEYVDDDAD